MNPDDILILGTMSKVVAIRKATGETLWERNLKPELFSGGDRFVSVLVDGDNVFVHTKGELYCLDLMSGQIRWKNPLKGLGYEIASLATRNVATGLVEAYRAMQNDKRRSSDAGTTATQ